MKHAMVVLAAVIFTAQTPALADVLLAGAAKVEISDRNSGPEVVPCHAKALVLRKGETTVALVTVDAVAIGEIGRIDNGFLSRVRQRLERETDVPPANLIVNASHCHGTIRADVDDLVVAVVKEAVTRLAPARVGAGTAQEDRISENRRLTMKDGGEIDMRRAYALPRDEEIAKVGPIDPQVGILRLDHEDGRPLAVVYNFACHPIMDPPHKGNSADFPGHASRLLEAALGDDAVALFVQGCGGDVNPVRYKESERFPDSAPLGLKLGLTVLTAWKAIETKADGDLRLVKADLSLPRAADFRTRIESIERERSKLVEGLRPTDINFKSFLPLYIRHRMAPDVPSASRQGYLHEESLRRDELTKRDAEDRRAIDDYLRNVAAMERLTRLNVNLALLKKHHERNEREGKAAIEAEMVGLRVGPFRLLTFPGELTVTIGMDLKRRAPAPFTFVAGYTNGYLYYLPTEKQRTNTDYAQEDCDCRVAPEWRRLFDAAADELLSRL